MRKPDFSKVDDIRKTGNFLENNFITVTAVI